MTYWPPDSPLSDEQQALKSLVVVDMTLSEKPVCVCVSQVFSRCHIHLIRSGPCRMQPHPTTSWQIHPHPGRFSQILLDSPKAKRVTGFCCLTNMFFMQTTAAASWCFKNHGHCQNNQRGVGPHSNYNSNCSLITQTAPKSTN